MKRETYLKVGLLLTSFFLSLLLSEIILRIVRPPPTKYYVWRPHLQQTFKPDPEILSGVQGEARFIINSQGIRSSEFPADPTYHILAVGGSTTECTYLDQSETWTERLQSNLNQDPQNQGVWVGNVGKSGMTTRHHILHLQALLGQYPQIDAVILLVGVNDLTKRLARDISYDPHFLDRPEAEASLLRQAFQQYPDQFSPLYKQTALWHLGRDVKRRLSLLAHWQARQDDRGQAYMTWRNHRHQAGAIRDTLPDMAPALAEYRYNLHAMIDLAQANSVRLILVTQPVMWRANLPEKLRDQLWFGGVGRYQLQLGQEYYSVEALAEGMDLYNQVLRQACQNRGIECVDLAAYLAKDTRVFYDDVHFNEFGAVQVADRLTTYLRQ